MPVGMDKWERLYAAILGKVNALDPDEYKKLDEGLAIDFQEHFAYPVEAGKFARIETCSPQEARDRKEWTCFVGWDPYDPGDMENGPRIEWRGGIEEIDVVAVDETDARIICEEALRCYYEPEGQIIQVRENIPGVTYI